MGCEAIFWGVKEARRVSRDVDCQYKIIINILKDIDVIAVRMDDTR